MTPYSRPTPELTRSLAWWIVRGVVFVGINVSVVGLYCQAMVGKLEPLKHHPEEFVIRPLMAITALVSLFLYPLLLRRRSRWIRGLVLYVGFVLISALYGGYLWFRFPDGPPWAVLLGVIGGHLYGFPPFLVIFLAHLALDRWLYPRAAPRERRGSASSSSGLRWQASARFWSSTGR